MSDGTKVSVQTSCPPQNIERGLAVCKESDVKFNNREGSFRTKLEALASEAVVDSVGGQVRELSRAPDFSDSSVTLAEK